MHRTLLGLAVAVVSGLGTMAVAHATPLAVPSLDAAGDLPIERVADGCGPGFHANPWGRCRPNRWDYGPPRGP